MSEDSIKDLRISIQGGALDFWKATYDEPSGTLETRLEHVHALIRMLQEEECEEMVDITRGTC